MVAVRNLWEKMDRGLWRDPRRPPRRPPQTVPVPGAAEQLEIRKLRAERRRLCQDIIAEIGSIGAESLPSAVARIIQKNEELEFQARNLKEACEILREPLKKLNRFASVVLRFERDHIGGELILNEAKRLGVVVDEGAT